MLHHHFPIEAFGKSDAGEIAACPRDVAADAEVLSAQNYGRVMGDETLPLNQGAMFRKIAQYDGERLVRPFERRCEKDLRSRRPAATLIRRRLTKRLHAAVHIIRGLR